MISFDQCRKKGKIVRFVNGPNLVSKEIETARYDLESAAKSLKEKNYKWSIMQGYYSLFHSLRALLFSKSFNEHSHICLFAAVEKLYDEECLLSRSDFDNLLRAKSLREGADYNFDSNEDSANYLIELADYFVVKVEKYLDAKLRSQS